MKKHSFAGYMVIRTKDYWRIIHYEKELLDGHRSLQKMLDKCRADCATLEIKVKEQQRVIENHRDVIQNQSVEIGNRESERNDARSELSRANELAQQYREKSETDAKQVVLLQASVNDQAIKIGALELRCRELIHEVQEARKMLYGVPDDLPPEIAAAVDWERMGLKEPKPR